MSDRLREICATTRTHVAAMKAALPPSELAARIAAATPPRGFRAALDAKVAAGGYGLIAEIKKASPSKGLIREDFDPPAHARAYAAGGAACLSVLTDRPYFQGDDVYLVAARAAVTIPALRKDFMVDPWQVAEARALGADAILIIVAALDDAQMTEIESAAIDHGMDVLVEVHDRTELDRALALRSRLIGVNNRDLRDFSVDLARTEELAGLVPAGTTLVAESGITGPADVARLAAHGIRCFLVGETLMRHADVESATRALLTA
ncbi:indole-3-glycerol phosphate synthase TrpC [Sphingomonas montana]|uniref:indole-3-glycerol phosphate synthase TrpC n=1 Tax=Sphingomonas montana TaxID=1843236 RepID=UPI00096FF934|nr:indole-3-glycerol phosphate synthase TrpC [Sphingomonas montana]